MPSGSGASAAGPPGKLIFAPLARTTSLPLAVTTVGADSLLRSTAPIQLHLALSEDFANGSSVKEMPASTGEGSNDGDSNFKKCVNGSASSPALALITARLLR